MLILRNFGVGMKSLRNMNNIQIVFSENWRDTLSVKLMSGEIRLKDI